MSTEDSRFEKFNEILNSLPMEEIQKKSQEQATRNEQDFQELKFALAEGKCNYCGFSILHFSE